MSPLLKKIALSVLLAFVQLTLFAQEVPPPPQRTPPSGLPMPIDNGVVFLLVVGSALGVFFVLKNKRNRKVA
ncbi:hypothetical protein EAX61_05050 [Dokdonia sinensis]|uniref:LPXTG cell wall anchor domain-containing protein n=1 Tax=Dokdonia sinensis TaxID=2479847 RepID=A0A3M0GJX8_9FLAO|nr:hypothetical protein [Dokdonia sinensis]RMB62942.1 hypothetical protein EAX61_05050 [Dokdonia sinensis]